MLFYLQASFFQPITGKETSFYLGQVDDFTTKRNEALEFEISKLQEVTASLINAISEDAIDHNEEQFVFAGFQVVAVA